MKHLLKILVLVPLCLACSSEMENENIPQGMKKAAIGFNAAVENARAVSDIDDVEANGFSVWGGYEGSNPKTVFEGEKITSDGNEKWTYEGTEYWTHNTYNFHGVYPTPDNNYSITWDHTNLEFKIKNFDSSSNIDLLHDALVDIDGSTYPLLNMNFKHLLTNVNVALVKDPTNVDDEIIVTGYGISGLHIQGDYSWKKTYLDDGTSYEITKGWTPTTETIYYWQEANLPLYVADENYSVDVDGEGNKLFGYQTIISDLLTIPQEISEQSHFLMVEYSYGELEGNYLYVPLPSTHQWVSNTKITYRAIIKAHMNIVFATISVNSWNTSPLPGTIIIK